MGTTIAAVASDLKADLKSVVKVPVVPVAYPAVTVFNAIDNGAFGGVNYPTSRADGVRALRELLAHQVKVCPSTKIVLAGYSQGADVIGTYLDHAPPANVVNRIAGVALVGDPRFNPADTAVDAGSFNPKYGPIYGRFGITPPWTHPPGRRPLFPEPLSTRAISVCNKGDPICNYSWSNAAGCFGIDAWKQLFASILVHVPIPIPDLRPSCAHLHYLDKGPTAITPGAPVTATAVGAFLAAQVSATLSHEASWTATAAPLPAHGQHGTQVSGVSCPTSSECAAVGTYNQGIGEGVGDGLLLTWSGGSWTAAEAPLPPDSEQGGTHVNGVSCPTASDCVAVGYYASIVGAGVAVSEGLLLTWSGGSWTAAEAPLPPNGDPYRPELVDGVSCPTSSECVAVGTYTDTSRGLDGLLLTWSKGRWTAAESPTPHNAGPNPVTILDGVSCPTSSKCIAVGSYAGPSGNDPLLLAWSGRAWATAETPLPANAAGSGQYQYAPVEGVSCPTSSECVAVGVYNDRTGGQDGLLLTWSGGPWTAAKAPLPANATVNPQYAGVDGVSCPTSSKCVAVGFYMEPSGNGDGLLLTRSGGPWTAAKAPLPPNGEHGGAAGVSCPTISKCVAVGFYTDPTTGTGRSDGLLLTGPG